MRLVREEDEMMRLVLDAVGCRPLGDVRRRMDVQVRAAESSPGRTSASTVASIWREQLCLPRLQSPRRIKRQELQGDHHVLEGRV